MLEISPDRASAGAGNGPAHRPVQGSVLTCGGEKALQLMGHEVGDSRYAVQFSDQQLQEIRGIIARYLA